MSEPVIKDSVEMKYDTSLQKVVRIYEKIKSMYKVLENLQPIAIAENNNFYIFDADENLNYKFIKKTPCKFSIPKGIRAAIPIDGYEDRSVCVVTGDVFDKIEDYVIIFHEFVHCAQFQTVEMKIKENLEIYRKAMEKQDYMWEINYAFPYNNENFEKAYAEFLNALDKKDTTGIKDSRNTIKSILSKDEYEYLTWQEWKEGYARYIENKLQSFFNLKINEYGKDRPYSRITFYAGGSKYIEYLAIREQSLSNDLESLYKNIVEIK